jgi:hypothetical protein
MTPICRRKTEIETCLFGALSDSRNRRPKAQALMEVLIGMFILIPIALFILDMVVLVVTNSANDSLAKNCARAAANEQTSTKANDAAQNVVASFHRSNIITNAILVGCNYRDRDSVIVETAISVKLPVTVLGINCSPTFHASAVEPIVGVSSAPGVNN